MFANRSSFAGSLAQLTTPKSLGTRQPRPGAPLTARETVRIQQLLPAQEKGHEPGFIGMGSGKGRNRKPKEGFKEMIDRLPKRGYSASCVNMTSVLGQAEGGLAYYLLSALVQGHASPTTWVYKEIWIFGVLEYSVWLLALAIFTFF